MYCIFAADSLKKMNGIRGKMASQAGHAFLHAWWNGIDAEPEETPFSKWKMAHDYYYSEHARKITCVVPAVEDLYTLYKNYEDVCGVTLVEDCGFTVFDEPVVTCVGIGPLKDELIDIDLRGLKLLT